MTGSDTQHTVPNELILDMLSGRDKGGRSLHHLSVHPNGQPAKKRTYHVVAGMGHNHQLGVFNNNIASVERALLERYFFCSVDGAFLPPLSVSAREYCTPELIDFRKRVVELVRPVATVLTLAQVRDCYTGAKWRIYNNAYRSLLRTVVNRKDATLRPFTKFEKQALTKACRIINPRSPRYNLALGKYLKKAEKVFFKAINEVWGSCTDHTVIKGMNVREVASVFRAKWNRFSNPVAVGLDATKFDMHVSVPALKYEHSFYNQVFGSEELAELLSWQENNQGTAYCPDGMVKFKMPGTRSSGDLNTSLGNCVIMCSLIWSLCRELGITAELANNGDDCVLIMEREDLAKFQDAVVPWFVRKGFRMAVEEPVSVFEEIEFCQSHPVWDGEGWTMVRNVFACLEKDPMCLIPVQNEKVWRKWLGAVGACGSALVPGIPVVSAFYKSFERSGSRSTDKFKQHIFKNTSMQERGGGLNQTARPVTPDARASFYKAFGITPDYQIAYEKYYSGLSIGCVDPKNRAEGIVELTPPPFIAWAPVIFTK